MGVIIRTNVHIGLWRHAMNDARCTTYTKLGLSKFALSWNCKRSWLLVMSMFCLLQSIRRLLGSGPILNPYYGSKKALSLNLSHEAWSCCAEAMVWWAHKIGNFKLARQGKDWSVWYICEFPQWHSTLVDMLATVMGCRLLHVSFSCLLWTYFKETQSISHTVAPVTLWQLCWMARVHG
jgi:hypothetical protein